MTETVRYNAPSWATDAAPLRGCAACDFGRDLATDPQDWGKLCRHPEVAHRTRSVPTDPARIRGGACGPDATFLTIKGEQL